MKYIKYQDFTGIVVEISSDIIEGEEGYSIALSDAFELGDEHNQNIHINKILQESDEDFPRIVSYSAVKQLPYPKELLDKISTMENENINLMLAVAELYETLMNGGQL